MKANFNTLIQSEKPLLVDFHATWCGPCKMQAPILKEVAGELKNRAKVITVDVDKNPAIAAKFQVRGVPTLILFKNGSIIWRSSGLIQKQQLLEIIENNM